MRHLFVNSLANFLKDRKQRVVLNGHHSKWVNVEPEVQGSRFKVQGSRFRGSRFLKVHFSDRYFSLYINDLSEKLVSNPKLFADDRSFF